ncbi:hypothetical protein DVA67_014520 [Solirubrobacter sp. CPCC 204708]|uniref:EfeO-type cupredoxin-like domain-containing protein n=1 Tax=Solirubrobacter deserti TaxID=2282478 RepID=A0ABT4RBL1_9ACTN|nr:hypothetical protein [Solirubrobacter deserti]MBE2317193.1 hypothetical protein [Solirubrobacter deserti]MDA0135914.1 hypothetical protein [Solirubrobacter deserti]
MLNRLGLLAATAVALGAGLVASASAQHPTSARFVITDTRATAVGTDSNDVTIALGGTVRFEYPQGAAKHNVNLERVGPECAQVAGAGTGTRGRIVPPDPEGPGWVVQCHFPAPGVYHFGSDENGTIHGVVRVADANGYVPPDNTPTPTPTPTATYVPGLPGGPGTDTTNGGGGSDSTMIVAGKSGLRWSATKSQRKSLRIVLTGGSERTTVTVEAQARRTDLRAKGKAKRLRVGRVTRTVNAGARVTVSIPLNAQAKSALRRLKKLSLTLHVTVAGSKATAQTVTLRR